MLTTKLHATLVARLVALSIVAGAIFIVASSLGTIESYACPVAPPQPLRVLYLRSDRIVVARVGKSEPMKADQLENFDSVRSLTRLKTALLVSSTLKGEAEPVVYVYHSMFGGYKNKISRASEDQTLLIFLKRSDEGDGHVVADMNYGIRELSDADLKVYVRRIEELAQILQPKQPNEEEIVEWLIRCTEEPATRWEGALELWSSQDALLSSREQEGEEQDSDAESALETESTAKAVEVAGDTISNDEEGVSPSEVRAGLNFFAGNRKFAQLLTAERKNRLMLALLNTETISNREYHLVNLVEAWEDARLVPFLISQLRRSTDDPPYLVEDLMMTIARKLDNKILIALVEEYENEAYSDQEEDSDDDEATESDTAEREASARSAAAMKLKAKLEYFITLAETTVPSPDVDKTLAVADSPQP